MAWKVEVVDDAAAALRKLPADLRAAFSRIAQMIEAYGLPQMREPHVKHIEGPLWEMRMRGKSGIARAAYVVAIGSRVVVVHVFRKKTQKTPRREIDRALDRPKDVR